MIYTHICFVRFSQKVRRHNKNIFIGRTAEFSSDRIADELNYLFDIYSSLTVCFILA